MSKQTVLIVGAGPAGLVLANELLRRDVRCRIIDRAKKPMVASRAFTVHSKTMEMFENMGISHRFLEYCVKSKGFTFNFKGESHRTELDFTKTRTFYPFITVFNQYETEKMLRDHVEARYGVEVEWGVSLTSLEKKDQGTEVQLSYMADSDIKTEQFDWVVGCDGIRSFVRESLGLSYEGEGYGDQLMQMMDTEIDGFDYDEDWTHYFMSKDSFLLITRLPGEKFRILVSDRGESKATKERSARDTFQEVFETLGVKGTIREPRSSTMWKIWMRQTNSYREGRVFLAGDAAHTHSPSGGQGMNACMQDTFNLGWKLAMVINGAAKETLLETYESERMPVASQVVDGTNDMHRIIMAHGTDLDDRIALTQRAEWHERAVAKISGLGYTYEEQQVIPEGMTVLPGSVIGSRAIDVYLHSKQRLFEITAQPKLSLIVLAHNADVDAAETLLADVKSKYHAGVKGHIAIREDAYDLNNAVYYEDQNGELFAEYGDPNRSVVLLIRPDGYIAFRALFEEQQYLTQHLDSFLVTA